MKPAIDLDSCFQGATISTYPIGTNDVTLSVNGISSELKGNFQYSLNTRSTRNQTVVLVQGVEWEIVIELRPRKLTETERIKLRAT